MLQIDMDGRVITPGRLVKTLGGDFDTRGIPSLFDLPTDGDYAGVTPSDYASDPYMAKTLSRSVAGKAAARGPVITLNSEHKGFRLRTRNFGGGSSATSGSTRRDYVVGLQSDDGQNGLFMEYRNPSRAVTGCFITGRIGGVDLRVPIRYQCNNPAERYAPEIWFTRNTLTGGWTATLCEGDRPRHVVDFAASDASLASFRPVVAWDWTYATGTFAVQVAQLSLDIFWRF